MERIERKEAKWENKWKELKEAGNNRRSEENQILTLQHYRNKST